MKTSRLLAVLVLASATVGAQTPQWQVSLTASLDPLPVGMCGAVRLTLLDPATRDVPRNPQGNRITIADFDMTVDGGTSAAGSYVDAYHYIVCGCPGGVGGATATVTATYPAKSLPAAARLRGVSFQQSATFTLAPPKGPVIPAACANLAAAPAGASSAAASGAGVMPGAAAAGHPSAAAGGQAAPSGAASQPASSAVAGQASTDNGAAAAAGHPSANAGGQAAPSGAASQPASGAVAGQASTDNGAAAAAGHPSATAGGQSAPNAAAGQVASGTATDQFGPPPAALAMVNPSGLMATVHGGGNVTLLWDQVPTASFYVVFGPGLAQGGQRVENVTETIVNWQKVVVTASNLPAGTHEWQVASYYAGNASTPANQWSRISATVAAPATQSPPASAPPPATAPPPAASGKYLVTIVGIRAYQASSDDLLSRDGVGDEIYAAAYIRRYNRGSGALEETITRRSTPHGDITHFASQRLQAGTRSHTGGIQDGDMLPDGPLVAARNVPAQPATFPLRLWEGTLTDGVEALVISPSLWEQDVGEGYYNQWLQFQHSINQSLFAKQVLQQQILDKRFEDVVFGMSGNDVNTGGLSLARMSIDAGMMLGGGGLPLLSLLSTTADRPLGLVSNGRDVTALPNHTVILTREIIETALAKPSLGMIPSPVANAPQLGLANSIMGTPAVARIGVIAPKPGIIVVQLEDRGLHGTLAFPERPAIYHLFIQVERVP